MLPIDFQFTIRAFLRLREFEVGFFFDSVAKVPRVPSQRVRLHYLRISIIILLNHIDPSHARKVFIQEN